MDEEAVIVAEKAVHIAATPPELTAEAINKLPLQRYRGPIRLIRSEGEIAAAIDELRQESVLGFDTETRPAFKKGTRFSPALLQLAGASTVYLFQISLIGFNEDLAKLLAEERILKAGVGLEYDIRQLKKLCKFKPAGFCELSKKARDLGMRKVSLRSLTAAFLGFRISKSAKCSNWAVANLKAAQIRYAATDAWVSREIYLSMNGDGVPRKAAKLQG